MDALWKHCIFCGTQLSSERVREHVVPQFLCGSVAIKDVCRDCNSTLGREADHLILDDPRLIHAVHELGLENLIHKVQERANTTLEDTATGESMNASSKRGRVRVIPDFDDSRRSLVPEDLTGTTLINRLTKDPPGEMAESEVVSCVESLMKVYASLEAGEAVSDAKLGVIVGRTKGRVKHEYRTDIKSGRRLAAKIALETAHLLIPPERLNELAGELDDLAEYAMGGRDQVGWKLMFPPEALIPELPGFEHAVFVSFGERDTYIDIFIFKTVCFRVLLTGEGSAARGPVVDDGEQVDLAGIVMTCAPDEEPRKYVGRRVVGAPRIDFSEIENL